MMVEWMVTGSESEILLSLSLSQSTTDKLSHCSGHLLSGESPTCPHSRSASRMKAGAP